MAKKHKSSIVAILDIGSSKVVCFIARITPHNQIEIIGIGHNISQGIRAGRITDTKLAESSIIQAVEAAEKMSGETISKINIGISSNNLISNLLTSDLMVTGHEINDKDLNRLFFQVLNKYNDQEVEVIHNFPYDYMLDGNRGIQNPLGMYGNNLSADFHVLTTLATHLMNINGCLSRCQLEVDNFISSSYASGYSCLSDDEKELGVTLIEFGGGCTSVSVFCKNNLLYTDGVPMGGMHVTNDIARGICTSFADAERIKNLYGTVVMTSADFNDKIEVSASSDTGHSEEIEIVDRSKVVEIIRARVEEILDIIALKVSASAMEKFGGNKIVITGGAALLPGVKEIVGHVFSKNVRIGYPHELNGLADSTSGLAFSSPIGMLMHMKNLMLNSNLSYQYPANEISAVGNVLKWFKENFG